MDGASEAYIYHRWPTVEVSAASPPLSLTTALRIPGALGRARSGDKPHVGVVRATLDSRVLWRADKPHVGEQAVVGVTLHSQGAGDRSEWPRGPEGPEATLEGFRGQFLGGFRGQGLRGFSGEGPRMLMGEGAAMVQWERAPVRACPSCHGVVPATGVTREYGHVPS